MLTLPVHSKKIAALHFDPASRLLWIAFRDGTIHSIKGIEPVKVMKLVSNIPYERTPFFQTHW